MKECMMQALMRSILFVGALFLAIPAGAVYNDNYYGSITGVRVYAETDSIYFRLANQPTSHPACNPAYFVIKGSVPENRRNQMLATLLAAQMADKPIAVGYDNVGGCADGDGYIPAYMIQPY